MSVGSDGRAERIMRIVLSMLICTTARWSDLGERSIGRTRTREGFGIPDDRFRKTPKLKPTSAQSWREAPGHRDRQARAGPASGGGVMAAAVVAEGTQRASVQADIAQHGVVQDGKDAVVTRRRTTRLEGFQNIQDHFPLSV